MNVTFPKHPLEKLFYEPPYLEEFKNDDTNLPHSNNFKNDDTSLKIIDGILFDSIKK